jgi:molybdate transport system substrate-binding protein
MFIETYRRGAAAMPGRFLALLLLLLVSGPALAADAPAKPLTVFGAASLTNALGELGEAFTKQSGVPVRFSFAASSTLARQIESGAGAGLYVSADAEWMDYLEQRGLVQEPTRHDLLGNRLALIAPADSAVELEIKPGFALRAALGGGRLATGDPENVPVGRYARSALTSLGVWNEVADRLVPAEDVRTALAYVARGEAPLGIVYATDAQIEKKVRLVGLFPESSHPRITYPMALTKSGGADAARFAEFLRSDTSRAVFERYGFIVLR